MKEQTYKNTLTDAELLAGWVKFPRHHPRYTGRIRLHGNEKMGFSVEMDCQSVKTGTFIYDCRPTPSIEAFRAVMELEK